MARYHGSPAITRGGGAHRRVVRGRLAERRAVRPGDSASGVFLQRFDTAGARLGDGQHVNTFTLDEQRRADVSARADGGFVVVWESGCFYGSGTCSLDGSGRAVAARRFDADGTPAGGEQIVNTVTAGNQYGPHVSSAPTARCRSR